MSFSSKKEIVSFFLCVFSVSFFLIFYSTSFLFFLPPFVPCSHHLPPPNTSHPIPSTHLFNQSRPPTSSTHLVHPPRQPILSTHLVNPPLPPTSSTQNHQRRDKNFQNTEVSKPPTSINKVTDKICDLFESHCMCGSR